MNRLYRSNDEKMIAGICGGLGKYFNVDPLIFRIIFVVLALPGFAPGILPYIILWFIVPKEPSAPLKA